jgi:hypothetical protein
MNPKESKIVSRAMAILGSQISDKKAKSSRANGLLGGRPKRKGLSGNSKQRRAEYRRLQKLHGRDLVERDGTHVIFKEVTT